MTPEQFCYWLQGIVETHGGATLTPRQFEIIRDHLATVFQKQTPDRPLLRDGVERLPTVPAYPVPNTTWPNINDQWSWPPVTICSADAVDGSIQTYAT